MTVASKPIANAADEMRIVFDFFSSYRAGRKPEDIRADLTFGNPHEMPLSGLVAALLAAIPPRDVNWFAYKNSEPAARQAVVEGLRKELGMSFSPEDIAMTQGAFGAIATAFSVLLNPGDECIIPVPGWFCYASVLRALNARPVKVLLNQQSFNLDIAAIDAAITPRTRIVVVNTPHNPTGVIYSKDRLRELAQLLERKSSEHGRPIFILSDEPYRRIRFDDAGFTSPAEVYPWTLVDYSYGKVLLAPGLRLGYLAVCPDMPRVEREELREMIAYAQVARGWGFPDATLQQALPQLEPLSIDIAHMQAKRDRVYAALTQWGYHLTRPQGTFYLWGSAPGLDSVDFAQTLAKRNVFVMPGTLFECPGQFRLCLTASDAMIEAALPEMQEFAQSTSFN
jgi:aspartate aminotransferase